MGKKRITTITEEGVKKRELKRSLKEEKGVRVPGLKGGERVVAVTAEPVPAEEEKKEVPLEKKKVAPKPPRLRGRKYRTARTKIDPTKYYSPKEAIKLAKETSIARFDGTLEAHFVTLEKGLKGEVELPYFKGKARKVAIVDEKIIEQIEMGKIDFDVLLATPEIMPGLVKYAKILGPKGLMPNPKAGTIVEDPQKAIKTFQKASISFKTEADYPLIHTVFGKTSQKEEELIANFETLIKAIGPKKIKKAVICSSMGPGIKVAIDNL